jgi:4-hydroxy-tetrahydrodipicolinate synthase
MMQGVRACRKGESAFSRAAGSSSIRAEGRNSGVDDMAVSSRYADFGISAALATAFDAAGRVDLARTAALARRLVDAGLGGVTLFGTTGEGPSIGLGERAASIDAVARAGVAPDRITCGVIVSAASDALDHWCLAAEAGCARILLAPPYYFKGVGDDGLFRWFAGLFEAMAGRARGVLLYHIPSVTEVPLSTALIERLKRAFPTVIDGVKDSSGDWAYTEALLAAHRDLRILVGHEVHLAAAMSLGGAGAISGLANLLPREMIRLATTATHDPRFDRLIEALDRHGVVPAIKALLAHRLGEPEWAAARAPLTALAAPARHELGAAFDALFAEAAAQG